MNIDYLQPIYDILSTDSDVLSIIGSGATIFFNDAPEDTSKYIVIYEISQTRIGFSKTNSKRIQINCYHTNQYKCAELSEYVDTALHSFQGEKSGVVFTSIYNVATTGILQTDNGEYIQAQDYRVIY